MIIYKCLYLSAKVNENYAISKHLRIKEPPVSMNTTQGMEEETNEIEKKNRIFAFQASNYPRKIMQREEIKQLLLAMQKANVQACIIPSTDPHAGEYTPDRWKTRQWLSGFTGSAGTLVITQSEAGLWTDSRYFLQAEEQLRGTGISLFKAGLPTTPSPEQWLIDTLHPNDTVGLEDSVYTAAEATTLIQHLAEAGIQVDAHFAPYDTIWKNRPPLPSHPLILWPEPFAGESARSKIQRLREDLRKNGCAGTLLASSDSIAWLFNLRGKDIDYNPVAICYAFISETEAHLFIPPEKLTPAVKTHLQTEGITWADYTTIRDHLRHLSPTQRILITPQKINYELYRTLSTTCPLHEASPHPVDEMKAIKNETEINGIRRAMQRDGVALVQFLHWLDHRMNTRQPTTEQDISHQLRHFRSRQPHYFSESFETIAAYGPHGAIVHYSAATSNTLLRPEGILLIDSGAHYWDGTTDITRTLALGPVSHTMKQDFTRLLKGNISLSTARFPQGTIGMQLDILARQHLWQERQNYLHGTGHGVGCFLNVHEGPQNIRMEHNPVALKPGMILSNEPGLYRAGEYGIRIENLLLVLPDTPSDWGEFHRFETLTLCPIDSRLVDRSLLTAEEISWLYAYHQQVFHTLSPHLSPEETAWLEKEISSYPSKK
jgi:Xaa-Pro aminopeptidase